MPENHLLGVPTVESPFFDEIFTKESLTEAERQIAQSLRDRGYAVLDFPDANFDTKAEAIKSALHDRYPWEQWRSGSADMRIQDAWTFNEDVRSLAVNQTIIDLLSKLYGRRAWPFQSLNFSVGTQQHYHTDSLHFSSIPERFMCGVWVALEDIGDEQGPLEYYPGSHKWPIYTNEHIGFVPKGDSNTQETFHKLWDGLVRVTGVQREAFHPKKGQALIWSSNLLHGGMIHRDKSKTRWSQVTHYYFEDCAYYTPMLSDPFRGSIKFRRLTDLTTMKPVENSFSGELIPDVFINAAIHGFDGELDIRRKGQSKSIKRRMRRLFGLDQKR